LSSGLPVTSGQDCERMAYYLAIDSGGTKATYALADSHRELARAKSGTIKRMRTDALSAAANLDAALADLERQAGVSLRSVSRTCIGTAGERVPLVADWLREAISARVGGDLILLGDIEIALDAAFSGAAGVLALAGTGSNVAGRDARGQITTAGGYGPALADQGSGHRIGEQALRAAFLAIDEGRTTSLLAAILAFWRLRDPDELVAFANQIPPPDASQLARLVIEAALAGDAVATAVLRDEGRALGYLVRLVLRRLTAVSPELPGLAFAGSILQNAASVRAALIEEVCSEFPGIVAQEGVVDPLAGALWRARNG
jgi:glucosamine kinase